ncbi:MAG TPA: NAD-dependent epimerase/dehydratase family protein [Abditibacteriaceae bacterium]|jgi:nucleoside-diphosphate-sugar epimerase
MHILFIGGTGLISTSIARQLLQSGHEVTLFNRGKSENRLPEGAQEIRGDRKNYAEFEALFADKTYDVVVDMVAFVPEDSASAIRAFKGRCTQFIHCSTVCVYSGPVEQIPTTETEPYHSIGSYGKNKAACEKLLLEAHDPHNFAVTIMRPSHSYGEGGNIIRPFGPADSSVSRLREGLPIIVQGDGNSVWASCHVDDVARGFIATMLNEKTYGQAYNISADEYFSWNQYHEIVAEVVGGTFNPVYIPTDLLREIAPEWSGGTHEIFAWPSVFDNSKLKRDTDYTGQTVSFREGTERTLKWLEENGKIAPSDPRETEIANAWRGLPFPKL